MEKVKRSNENKCFYLRCEEARLWIEGNKVIGTMAKIKYAIIITIVLVVSLSLTLWLGSPIACAVTAICIVLLELSNSRWTFSRSHDNLLLAFSCFAPMCFILLIFVRNTNAEKTIFAFLIAVFYLSAHGILLIISQTDLAERTIQFYNGGLAIFIAIINLYIGYECLKGTLLAAEKNGVEAGMVFQSVIEQSAAQLFFNALFFIALAFGAIVSWLLTVKKDSKKRYDDSHRAEREGINYHHE